MRHKIWIVWRKTDDAWRISNVFRLHDVALDFLFEVRRTFDDSEFTIECVHLAAPDDD